MSKQNPKSEQRILGRVLARELSHDELAKAVGGLPVATTSCSNCQADDCDVG